MAVSRRSVDHHTGIHQTLTGGINIIHLVGQMPEVATFAIALRLALF